MLDFAAQELTPNGDHCYYERGVAILSSPLVETILSSIFQSILQSTLSYVIFILLCSVIMMIIK